MSVELHFPDSGKVIGPADGVEAFPASGWISAGCSIDEKDASFEVLLSNIKETYPRLLRECPQLRLKLCLIKNFLHWVLAEDSELSFDDMVRVVDPPTDSVPKKFSLNDHPIWRLEMFRTREGDKSKCHLLFHVSHGLADGSSTFALLDLFASIATKKEIPQSFLDAGRGPLVTSFDKRSLFTVTLPESIPTPAVWKILQKCSLYPKVTLPSHVVNTQWSTDYAPISTFCSKHDVSVQAILMTMTARAIRNFHKGTIDDIPLVGFIPVNTRHSPSATPAHANSVFYPGAGIVYPSLLKQPTLLEEVIHCKEMLHSALASGQAVESYCFHAELPDKQTFAVKVPENFPNINIHNLIVPSNIGLVCSGRSDLVFRIYTSVGEYGYWPDIYSFHNGKTLYFMFVHPFNIGQEFLDAMRNSYHDILQFILKDIEE